MATNEFANGYPAVPDDARALTEAIRARALELGFDAIGFAAAEPSAHADRLNAWLAAGMHAGMTWLERNADRRLDPQLVLPGAKSVVCVAMNYGPGDPPPEADGEMPRGQVARYAWGDDYHDVMLERLRRLQADIAALSGGKAYVDTGPILEREVAARAGVGWVGKNAMLIRRGLGSWLLLGELLTTAELVPDAPVRDLCGSCARCIDACPTGAIVADRVIDSRRCISYLTIEEKGSIPEELRAEMGRWVFGCDVCQEVCPWNRKVSPSPMDPFATRGDEVRAPDLTELVRLSAEAFRERFRGSAMKRTKRRGLLRNAAIALGNIGDPHAVPALMEALADEEPLVREHAAWALRRIGGPDADAALARHERLELQADVEPD